jgi:hypothetical protein
MQNYGIVIVGGPDSQVLARIWPDASANSAFVLNATINIEHYSQKRKSVF